ncbi:ParB-like partition protein (plasmid) [Cylindrospermum stagnale PCC 7417]|uniref:ParB-like partition protein n=1 Tax=Cylindrospermum stagnale PCC 7417 TaxID=56107 RepID=K9X9N2_9NOST|nr:ParB/RepB/Spo0J family partition protein [Cylindrospermum stagnale]AFZ28362.1 ParB-like partition protein [Cylindrospermum stagnale PCC 7417]
MPKPDISNAFATAGQSQKIHHLTQRVEELESEITHLRAVEIGSEEKIALELRIQELVAEVANKQGVEEVAINLIDRNPRQPRQTFTKASIQGMAELLKTQGQHTPIILIPLSNGRYLLFDGERRWRAAHLLGWKALKAVFIAAGIEVDDRKLHRQALSTTLHREDLNALDLAESLIQQIIYDYPDLEDQKDAIPRLLNAAMSRLERNRKNLELADIRLASKEAQQEWIETVGFKSPEEENIFEVILELQLNPTSIDTNIFPLLKVSQDLKNAIRDEGLEGSKARELNKLSAEQLNIDEAQSLEIRVQLTRRVIQEKLSLSRIKVLVKDILKQYKSSDTSTDQKKKMGQTVKTIQSINFEGIKHNQLEEIRQALEEKLQEIDQIMTNNVVGE